MIDQGSGPGYHCTAPDKRGVSSKYFSYFSMKIYIVVLIRRALTRRFLWVPTTYVLWRNKKYINTFGLKKKHILTLKAPITTAADNNFLFSFFLFFRENKSWHFMWIICQADNSHEMSRLVFSEKKKKFLECPELLLQILLGALRVKLCSARETMIMNHIMQKKKES